MEKMFWVAAIAFLGLANNVNGQCCHESMEIFEAPLVPAAELIGGESDLVFADAAPVVFNTAETVGTEVLIGESIEYPIVENAGGCGCLGYSPVAYYGEGISFVDGEVVEQIDNAIIEGEVISESEATVTSAPLVESANEEPTEETPVEDEGEIEEAYDEESEADSEPNPFDSDDVADEAESEFGESDFETDEELDQDLGADNDE